MSMKEGKRSAVYTVNLPIQQFRGVVAYLTRLNTAYRLTHLYANGIYAHDERHAINWVAWIKTFIFIRSVIIKEFKRGIGSLLTPMVTLCGGGHIARHVWRWFVVPSDLTRSFGAIYTHYRYVVIHRAITFMHAWFESTRERQLTLNEIIWRT